MSRTKHDFSVWNKPLIDTCQHCSTSQANQALRSLANAGFQNRGVCLQAFPSFPPPPPPSFTFWLSFHFSRGQYRKSPSSVFLCSETKRKRLLRRLHRRLGQRNSSPSKRDSTLLRAFLFLILANTCFSSSLNYADKNAHCERCDSQHIAEEGATSWLSHLLWPANK